VPRFAALPPLGREDAQLISNASESQFTLRDLYVRASISGNSMAAELGRYLNINETTFSSSTTNERTHSYSEPSIHERALAAILEVVTTETVATNEYVRTPEPHGGVQEWWTRMISGSVENLPSMSNSTVSDDDHQGGTGDADVDDEAS
jgi:hypothetical protein